MGQIKLTEKQLKDVLTRITEEELENKTEERPTESNPLAEKMFADVKNYMEGLAGAFSLKDVSTKEDVEDDKLIKTWNWKSNDGKVTVSTKVDIKMKQ
jgi:hypothetical protein|tara:strand:- start:1779 stop:2072 length:294 start_codon:yes stop_codon:yes gene_type:complete